MRPETPPEQRKVWSADGNGPTWAEYIEAKGLPWMPRLAGIAQSITDLEKMTREWSAAHPAETEPSQPVEDAPSGHISAERPGQHDRRADLPMPATAEGPAMSPAPAEYGDRCRAAVEAEGLPFLAQLIPPSQGVPDFLKLTREYVKVTAPKTAAASTPSRSPARPAPPNFDAIPAALQARPAWLLWRLEARDGLITKVPYRAAEPGRKASTTDPATWSDFETARDAYTKWYEHGIDGVGFVLSDADPFVGIDVDHIRDPATGELDPRVINQVLGFGSYAEYSQSGDGVHVIAIGRKPGEDCRKGNAEMYATGRYFVMTGRHIDGTPDDVTEANPGALEAFYGSIARETRREVSPAPKAPAAAPAMADDEIIERARDANNGAKFSSLFDAGSTAGYPSHSEADAALCALLAFWTRDAYQIDRLFRRSGLMRDKWDTPRGKSTYGADTIESAIGLGGETYTPTPAPKRARAPAPVAPPAAEDLARFVYRGPRGALRVDDAAVADYLYEQHSIVSFNDHVFVYQDGIYALDKGTVSAEVKRFIRECGTHEQLTRVLREVIAHLLATNPFTTQPFNLATNLIPVANGVISIDYETGRAELLDHSPGYRFTYKLPVTFDPDATPADALALLSQYVAPEDVPLLVQPFAQALLQTQLNKTYKKNYLIQGNRDAAKSTYTLILEGFFGPENISHVSLQALTTDRFCKGRMENKLINYFDDLDAVPLSQIGLFKALTGSTTHDIERKFESGYAGRIVCPHLFTCNRPPRVADDAKTDDAWWGRWEYVRFPYSFPIDPTFPDRTLTPAFYSSLLAAVLAMMIEIRQRGSLTINRTPAEVQQRWNVMSDPLFQFIDAKMERLAATVNDFDKGKLFRAYLTWCEDTGLPMGLRIQTTTAFTQALEPYGIQAIHTSKKIDGRKRDYEIYRGGYRWKNEKEDMGYDFGPFTGGAN